MGGRQIAASQDDEQASPPEPERHRGLAWALGLAVAAATAIGVARRRGRPRPTDRVLDSGEVRSLYDRIARAYDAAFAASQLIGGQRLGPRAIALLDLRPGDTAVPSAGMRMRSPSRRALLGAIYLSVGEPGPRTVPSVLRK